MSDMTAKNDIDKLTNLLHSFMEKTVERELRSEERATRSETQIQNLIKSVDRVSEASKNAIESNTKLEAKITSLEDRAINKLNLVEDSVNENESKITLMDGRIHALELINANRIGEESGRTRANEHHNKKATSNWTRTISVIGIVLTVVGLSYKFITTGG